MTFAHISFEPIVAPRREACNHGAHRYSVLLECRSGGACSFEHLQHPRDSDLMNVEVERAHGQDDLRAQQITCINCRGSQRPYCFVQAAKMMHTANTIPERIKGLLRTQLAR